MTDTYISLHVTPAHISAGIVGKEASCPVALALTDSGVAGVIVGAHEIWGALRGVPVRMHFGREHPVSRFVAEFDHFGRTAPVAPCTLPVELTSAVGEHSRIEWDGDGYSRIDS